jgi:hypothetical protein
MTFPMDPPVDPEAPPVSEEAPGAAALDDEIRQLAAALGIQQQQALQGRKAVVESISLGDAVTPPTITVDLSGVSVEGIRLAASYTPQVGDTVLLLKQGNEFFAAFKITDAGTKVASSLDGGWTKATLNSGHSHNGNSNGDLLYRRVLDHGAWKIQWQGAIGLGASDTIISGGNALASEYRPASRRSLLAARQVDGAVAIFVDFNTDGTVVVVGATEGPSGTTGSSSPGTSGSGPYDVTHSHGGSTGVTDPPDGLANAHAHSIPTTSFSVGSHSHTVNSHTHSIPGTVSRPTFVSFNGLEYFL